MWSTTNFYVVTLSVSCYHFMVVKTFNKFNFVWLVVFFHNFDCISLCDFFSNNIKVCFYNFIHFIFNNWQIVIWNWSFKIDIIIKAIFCCWTNPKFCGWKNCFDCLCQNMCRWMSEHFCIFRAFVCYYFKWAIFSYWQI